MMYDLVLHGGTLIDGTGGPPRDADVAISGGRVALIGRLSPLSGRRSIDVSGLMVSPGFIDLHTHCDFTIHSCPDATAMTRQGVTTLVMGNCGFSAVPVRAEAAADVAEWASFLGADESLMSPDVKHRLTSLRELPLGPNLVQLVGHGTIRLNSMTDPNRPASTREVATMVEMTSAAVDAGAAGLSSGLIYAPGLYAEPAELVALARAAAANGGWYATHIRDERGAMLDGLREAIDVAAKAHCSVQVSHLKVIGRENWGAIEAAISIIESATAAGLDLTADQYPYTATSTKLSAALPAWALAEIQQRRGGPSSGSEWIPQLVSKLTSPPHNHLLDPRTTFVADPPGHDLALVSLEDLATRARKPAAEVLVDLVYRHGDTLQMVASDRLSEDDVQRVIRHRGVAVASDGWSLAPDVGGNPHPRSFGSFARILGRYVRDLGVLSWQDAVHKMAVVPSRRLGLRDRGRLSVGSAADVVVFDPDQVADTASLAMPYTFAVGILHVLVNGVLIVDGRQSTGASPGQLLTPHRGPAI